jgi:hypothetical protein
MRCSNPTQKGNGLPQREDKCYNGTTGKVEPLARSLSTSEDKNFEGKPTSPKTDSSGCFGIPLNKQSFNE